MKDVNDDELVLNSSLREFNGGGFYKRVRDIVERTNRHFFYLQYKKQSNNSKNHVIQKLY